jgi:hypothetical protein
MGVAVGMAGAVTVDDAGAVFGAGVWLHAESATAITPKQTSRNIMKGSCG